MAEIIPTYVMDAELGEERILWLAIADSGETLGTGDTLEDAAWEAHHKLLACADLAERRGLPSRYIRRLRAEADMFRPARSA